jgi:hypothetical protein
MKFTGIAFISFDSEDDKDLVLKYNTFTLRERLGTLLNRG